VSGFRSGLGSRENVSYSDESRRAAGEGLLRNFGVGGGSGYWGFGVGANRARARAPARERRSLATRAVNKIIAAGMDSLFGGGANLSSTSTTTSTSTISEVSYSDGARRRRVRDY
jgi:hypothetical protein